MPIIAPIPRSERRLMQKTIHRTRGKNHARSSIIRRINWFTLYGIDGLESLSPGRGRCWPFEHICTFLREPVKHTPGDFGYQRSRWSTELMAIKINEITGYQ